MVESNILKGYHLWSDVQLLLEGTMVKIPKKEYSEKNNQVYDSLLDSYVDSPLLYCHIVDLEVVEENTEYDLCIVKKCIDIGY